MSPYTVDTQFLRNGLRVEGTLTDVPLDRIGMVDANGQYAVKSVELASFPQEPD